MEQYTADDLRPADLIAKVAGVNLKSVVKVLAALDVVSYWLDKNPIHLLEHNETTHPTEGQSNACSREYSSMQDAHLQPSLDRVRIIGK